MDMGEGFWLRGMLPAAWTSAPPPPPVESWTVEGVVGEPVAENDVPDFVSRESPTEGCWGEGPISNPLLMVTPVGEPTAATACFAALE
eukprot:4147300-Pyramimonas_sp.AAC.1